MAPRAKRTKNIVVGTADRVEKENISGWERSKISSQDRRMLRKMGLLKNEAMQMRGDESVPHQPEGFRVIFTDFLVRGLSVPFHEFLRGLLFIYEIQLHQLTPNSILHIYILSLCASASLASTPTRACGNVFSISTATTRRTPSPM
jgi:hypothetical protein